MNVTKGIAALTLAALMIPTQGILGGTINYIVSEDTTTELKLTVNHPDSTFGSSTFKLSPPLTNWSVGGTITDKNAGLFSAGIDTVTITGMTIQHTANPHPGETAAFTFTVPAVTAAGAPVKGSFTSPLIKYTASAIHPPGPHYDNVEVAGTFKWHGTKLSGSDIDAYNFVVLGDHGSTAKFAVVAGLAGAQASAAFGTMAGFYHQDTNRLNLELGIVGLQKSDITGIQITSNTPGFTSLALGTSALTDGSNGVAWGGDLFIPLADRGAIEAGDAFVSVMTHDNPNGEIGGTLQNASVPEPSSFILLASGIAGLTLWRKKIAVQNHSQMRLWSLLGL